MSPSFFCICHRCGCCWCHLSAGLPQVLPTQLNAVHISAPQRRSLLCCFPTVALLTPATFKWVHPAQGKAWKFTTTSHSLCQFLHIFHLYLTKILSGNVQQASEHLQDQPPCVCKWNKGGCLFLCVWQKIKSWKFAVLWVNPSILAHTLHHPFHLSKDWCVACMENKHVVRMYVSNATQGLDPDVYLCAYSAPYFIVNISTDNS